MATVQVNQTWTSGAFSTTNNYVKFKVRIKEISYDTVANTSEVTVSVYAYRTNSGYTTYGSGTIDVEIEGTNYHQSISPTITDANTTLFTQDLTIPHEADGSLVVNTSTEWAINAPGSGGYNYTGTTSAKAFNKTLSTIPRGSTITAPDNANMGSSISITVTQTDASFSHKLYYLIPGGAETLIGSYAGTHTYSWTVYNASASMGATERSRQYTLVCYTYFSDDFTGDYVRTEKALRALISPAYYPSISITSIQHNLPAGFPYLIGVSLIRVVTTAATDGTALFGQRVCEVSNGVTVAYGGQATNYTFTINRPLNAVTNTVTVRARDTRNNYGTATTTLTAIPYTAPTIELQVSRADSNGDFDPVGTYCKVEAKWKWQSIMNPSELNGATITVQVNGTDTATYTTNTNNQTAWAQIALLSGFSITDQYAITATITDTVGESGTADKTLGKAYLPLSLLDNGNDLGVTVGRTATQGGFINWLDTGFITGKDIILYDTDGTVLEHILTDDLFSGSSEAYYHDSDVFHITQGFFSGVLASSNKRIVFTVQLPKRLDFITSVSFTTMNLTVRGRTSSSNGTTTYLPAANTDYTASGYTITVYNGVLEENVLTIDIEHTTALGGLNNSDLLIAVNDLTVVFNE